MAYEKKDFSPTAPYDSNLAGAGSVPPLHNNNDNGNDNDTNAGNNDSGNNNNNVLTNRVKSVNLSAGSTIDKPQPTQIGAPWGNWGGVLSWLEQADSAINLPTKEELEKERRRYKTEKTVGAIGDTVSALANLFATTGYAPSAYKQENSLADKAQAKHDKMMQDYRENADRHLNYAMQIARIKDNQEQTQYTRARQDMLDQIEQAKADNAAKLADLKEKYLSGKITDQEQAALAKQAEEEYKARLTEARINALNSQAAYNNRRSTGGSGRGGSGHNNYYTETTTKDGVVFDRYGNAHNVTTTTTKNRAPYTGKNNAGNNNDLETYRRDGGSRQPAPLD
jgi:hypothetical protein